MNAAAVVALTSLVSVTMLLLLLPPAAGGRAEVRRAAGLGAAPAQGADAEDRAGEGAGGGEPADQVSAGLARRRGWSEVQREAIGLTCMFACQKLYTYITVPLQRYPLHTPPTDHKAWRRSCVTRRPRRPGVSCSFGRLSASGPPWKSGSPSSRAAWRRRAWSRPAQESWSGAHARSGSRRGKPRSESWVT